MRQYIFAFITILSLLCSSLIPHTVTAMNKDHIKKLVLNGHKLKTIQNIQTLKSKKKHSKNLTSLAENINSNPVNYTGQINDTKTVEYVFKVATASTIQVTANHESSVIDYALVGTDSDGNLSYYSDGDTLPPGDYSFYVLSYSPSTVEYSYELSNVTFYTQPDNHLPGIVLTNPSFPMNRLPANTTNIVFSGSTDTQTQLSSNQTFYKSFAGDFTINVPLHLGHNFIDLQSVSPTGNAVYMHFDPVVPGLKRIGGANRYEVSANISREMPDSTTVIIASGETFPDALSGGSISGLFNAPVLLTQSAELSSNVIQELQRRKPEKAIILGGTGSVSGNVERKLSNLGVQQIERIDGPNRFAVSAGIAKKLFDLLGAETSDTAIITNGIIFSDALSASSISSKALIPTLLVTNTSLPTEINQFLQDHPHIKNFIIVGGTGSVSNDIAYQLTRLGGNVSRIDGQNRYQVNVNLANYFAMDPGFLVFANGTNFPDALSGGPFASSLASVPTPLLLTPANQLDANVQSYLNTNKNSINVIYILGGTGSVSSYVESQVNEYIH